MPDSQTPMPLSAVAEINPPLGQRLGPTDTVSFIPMADVSDTGQWVGRQSRRYAEVAVGYTPFKEGDVLFAKITPCMENGKGCHALGLANGIGFGSTEFHVLRVRTGQDSQFLYHWLQSEAVRRKAEAFMIRPIPLTPPSPRGWAAVIKFRPTGCGWWRQVNSPIYDWVRRPAEGAGRFL